MEKITLACALSSIHTFEEYEKFKLGDGFLEEMAKQVIRQHQLPGEPLTLFSEGTNIVFAYGDSKVIKIFPPFHQNQFHSDLIVLKHLQGKLSVKTPAVEYEGELMGWPYLVMSQLEGILLETLWENMEYSNKIIIMRELGVLIKEVHALPTEGLESIDCHWEKFLDRQLNHCLEQHQSNQLPSFLLQQLPDYLASIKELLPKITKPVLLTGEYTPMNFLVKQVDGVWHIAGLIDFGDAMLGLPQYDLLGPGAFLIQGDKVLLKEFLVAYGYSLAKLTGQLSCQLMALMLLHQYSNLNIQIRIKDWQSKLSNLKDLEQLVWGM